MKTKKDQQQKAVTREAATRRGQQQVRANTKAGDVTPPRKLSVRSSFSVFLADFKAASSK